MAYDWIGPAATGLGAVVAVGVGGITIASGISSLTLNARLRASVRKDQEILHDLDENSPAASQLRLSVERRSERLAQLELVAHDPPLRAFRYMVAFLRITVLVFFAGASAAYFIGATKFVDQQGWDDSIDSVGDAAGTVALYTLFALVSGVFTFYAKLRAARRFEVVLEESAGPALHVDEPGVVQLGAEGDGAGGSVPLLGDDDVTLPGPR